MIYQKFLNKIRVNKTCPFCFPSKKFIIRENIYAYLTIARAPYVRDHLLVIPKKHIKQLHELREKERMKLMDLIVVGVDLLHKKYNGVETSYKEGNNLKTSGKSINHLHFHLVPKKKVKVELVDKRKFLSENDVMKQVKKFKNNL